jgi:hypothetical protein
LLLVISPPYSRVLSWGSNSDGVSYASLGVVFASLGWFSIIILCVLGVLCGEAVPFLRVLGVLGGEAFPFLRGLAVFAVKLYFAAHRLRKVTR